MPTPQDPQTQTVPAATDDVDAARRAALATLGTLAAWTPPTIMALLLSSRASAESTVPPPPS